MTREVNYLSAGKLVLFSDGEYSDYSFGSCYVATKTVSFADAEQIAKGINDNKEKEEENTGWYDGCVRTDFIMRLISNGWLVEVDVTERHLGSYGCLEV